MSDRPAIEFTITEKQLDTGLRGYPVGTCWTSGVDPQRGVSYVGYPIAEIAHLPPEDVIYLLFHKHLPSADEAAAFRRDLQQRAEVDPAVYSSLKGLPSGAHPMEMLCVGIQLLGMTAKTGDYKEDALNLVARIPSVLAAIFRIREDWGDPIEADQSLDYVANFVHMLGMPSGDLEKLTTLLRTFYVLHMDHGGGNLSTLHGQGSGLRSGGPLSIPCFGDERVGGAATRPGESRLPGVRAPSEYGRRSLGRALGAEAHCGGRADLRIRTRRIA